MTSASIIDVDNGEQLPPDTVWLDLFTPTRSEELFVEHALGLCVPTREEMAEIEPSSRLYIEKGALFLTANVLAHADTDDPVSMPVTFVLAGDKLITVRYDEPRPFKVFASHAQRQPELCSSSAAALMNLIDAIVDRTADVLEKIGADLDAISKELFRRGTGNRRQRMSNPMLEDFLNRIGDRQDLVSKARDSLVSLSRALSFLSLPLQVENHHDLRQRVKTQSRDVSSLIGQASYLADNISFLLDATLGLINVEQNAIIKIFSVAAVVFLPPTLVASIYGMNFEFMPELRWPLGYPFAIGLMILAAVLPYLYFKRKGWL